MAQKKVVLCDTNVLIELSKGNPIVESELKIIGAANIAISSISAGEFIFGALNKQELAKIRKSLNSIQLIHVSEYISEKALLLLEQYSLSHHLDVPDAFIAATSLVCKFQLYTYNLKDFRFIDGIDLYEF